MTKEAYNEQIIEAGLRAAYDVLSRPKNLAKPPMTDDIGELYFRALGEMDELGAEVTVYGVLDYALARAEAGDVIAYLCALVYECDRRLANEATR